ncbi:MAG: hypothetical protein HBSAPP03_19020 [Phycisphaerae bacterium]|nr:MAG: hypothetical protein HBSAPP03_19020 [Phycisphaerae bacterium]
MKWRTEDYSTLTAAQLEALAREVEGRRDHPRRAEYERALAERASGPYIIRYQLFCAGDGTWRLNTTYPSGDYTDAAMSDDAAWQFSGKSLKVFDVSAVEADPEQAVSKKVHVFKPILDRLLFAGLGVREPADFEVRDVVVSASGWSAVYGRPTSLTAERQLWFVLKGVWDHRLDRGFVQNTTLYGNAGGPSAIRASYDFQDWAYDERLGRWVAGRVEHRTAAGLRDRVIVYEGSEPLPAAGLASVLDVPTHDGIDAIRGKYTFLAITDFRDRTAAVITPDGIIPRSFPIASHDPTRIDFQTIGWGLLGAASVVLVVLVVRRRMNTVNSG